MRATTSPSWRAANCCGSLAFGHCASHFRNASGLAESDIKHAVANPCSLGEFYGSIIRNLRQQVNDLDASLQRIAADGSISDRFAGTVCKFVRLAAEDFDTLRQAAETEKCRADVGGKMIRARQANDGERMEQLRAEMATVPVLDTRPRDRAGMPTLVKPTQPPALRAKEVSERLGLSPDAVMRESIRGNLAKPVYQDGSPLWRESDVDQYLAKEQHGR